MAPPRRPAVAARGARVGGGGGGKEGQRERRKREKRAEEKLDGGVAEKAECGRGNDRGRNARGREGDERERDKKIERKLGIEEDGNDAVCIEEKHRYIMMCVYV